MYYIASLYRLDAKTGSKKDTALREKRYQYVMERTANLMKVHIVHSPIVHCHVLANTHDLPKTYEFWKETDRGMIDASEGVIVLKMKTKDGKGWEDSEGMSDEVNYAKKTGKEVIFLDCFDYKE